MNILHITESNGFSGGVNQAILISREFEKYKINSSFACPTNALLRERVTSYPVFDFNPKGSFDFKTILNLKKLFETQKFDVILAHHPKAHNYSFWAKKISKHKPILIAFRRVSHPIPSNIFVKTRYKSDDTDLIIAVSKSVEKILIEYGINPQKIWVVYSGVDTSVFYKKEKDLNFKKSLGLNENDIVISHIGNFSKEKGQEITLKAASLLYTKGYKFKLLFAGLNTDSNQMKELISKSQISLDKTVLLGLRKDVDKILNITDISVNSSIKGEALSGAIRESLACGVCVVVSNISGNNEIVIDGVNGYLFEKENYNMMAEKLEILIKNKELREKFSKNAIATISEKFTINKTAQEIIKAIEHVKYKKTYKAS